MNLESGHPTLTFLSNANGVSVTFDLFKKLLQNQLLSAEDQQISGEILSSLEENDTLPFLWTAQEGHWLQKNDPAKWLEYILYRFRFRLYPQRQIVAQFPVYLLIEPTSKCNLRCPMCFQVDKTFTKKQFMGTMDYHFFCRLIDESVKGGTNALTLGSRGEPTLNKDLGKMIRYASNKFLEFKVITNATRLTEQLCHDILTSDVDILVFSIDAHTKDVYETIRVNGRFEEVLDNVRRFRDIREQYYPHSKLVTRVSGVEFQEDQDSKGFEKFWSTLADEVCIKTAFERWNTYTNEKHPELISPCKFVWERMYVWHDGQAGVCDSDYKTVLAPGNVAKSSIYEVWHGNKLKTLREDHMNRCRNRHNPCDRCGIP